MEWLQYLLVLICPLMMLFCMKGMMGGHKHNHDHNHNAYSMDDLNMQMANLQAENEKLRKEISDLSLLIKKES